MKTVTQGRLFLLTGLSGSGKSTLGHLLVSHLNQYGVRNAYLLDGDAARAFFEGDSAFDAEARDAMTRRMAFAALTLTQNNVDVVMANIAGLRATRRFLRHKFADFIEIFLDVELDTLIRNDVKGLYKTRLAAERPMLVGVDIPYERPESPELAVFPHRETPEDSLKRILEFLSHRGPIMGTKADTLASLTAYVKRSRILPQVVLTWDHLTRDPVGQLHRVRGALGEGPYILRSSCRAEDARSKSNAGAFKSVPDVPDEGAAFQAAARRVRDSYAEKGVEKPDTEQILVQPMLSRVRMAGVVCTRHKAADSPYYVVNYDDRTGRTDTVTSGRGGDMIFISRFLRHEELGAWQALIDAVRELEELYPKFPVEVEFAVLETGEIVVLQCRALHVHLPAVSLEQSAGELIQELKLRLDRCRLPQPHLPGDDTILSDMADWNPSEMIGDRPSTLAYSIYRELVTDRTWHEARASQGYFDVLHANLMLSMARKPYMDTRMSFASLTPAAVCPATRERLVALYLDTLRRVPQLHDKVEFDLLYTCCDLGVERRIRARGGLTEMEIAELLTTLRELTNTLVVHAERDIAHDFARLERLEAQRRQVRTLYRDKAQYWDYFNMAYLLFEPTRLLGVLPFARLARLAFIARSLLFSLADAGLVASTACARVLSSIPTVASQFTQDWERLRTGRLTRDAFLTAYGHLRMSTYDIGSPRYDQLPDAFWAAPPPAAPAGAVDAPEIDETALGEVGILDRALAGAGLAFDTRRLLRFVRQAIQAREESKFRFTRSLSDAMECLARGGELLGFTRQELQFVTLPVLLRFRNPEFGASAKASQYLRQRMGEKAGERSAFDLIKLPSVLADARDLELVRFTAAKPNFISERCVTAPVLRIAPQADPAALEPAGKMVIIENADPGYDWIFAYPIAGLITKYGGVASHMAIRCAEFDLPGAIGCGELIFSRLEQAHAVRLDCAAQVIHAV